MLLDTPFSHLKAYETNGKPGRTKAHVSVLAGNRYVGQNNLFD